MLRSRQTYCTIRESNCNHSQRPHRHARPSFESIVRDDFLQMKMSLRADDVHVSTRFVFPVARRHRVVLKRSQRIHEFIFSVVRRARGRRHRAFRRRHRRRGLFEVRRALLSLFFLSQSDVHRVLLLRLVHRLSTRFGVLITLFILSLSLSSALFSCDRRRKKNNPDRVSLLRLFFFFFFFFVVVLSRVVAFQSQPARLVQGQRRHTCLWRSSFTREEEERKRRMKP